MSRVTTMATSTLILCLAVLVSPAIAQEPLTPPSPVPASSPEKLGDRNPPLLVFASGGLGVGSKGIAAIASLEAHRKGILFVARTAIVEEFTIFGPSPAESASDYGLMIGKAAAGRHGIRSAAVGIGLVRSVRRGPLVSRNFFSSRYQKLERYTVGVPFEVMWGVHIQGIGIGVTGFGDVNAADSFAGLAFTLQLGKLR
jgi:hypothetical protein